MKHREAVQYQADHVGLIKGADTDFGMPIEMACEDCGDTVDLSAEITVQIVNVPEAAERMTEANARQLLAELGVAPPPVMCERHEEVIHGL